MYVVKVQLQWKIYWIFKFFQVRQHRGPPVSYFVQYDVSTSRASSSTYLQGGNELQSGYPHLHL
jgi:hypothetical protein